MSTTAAKWASTGSGSSRQMLDSIRPFRWRILGQSVLRVTVLTCVALLIIFLASLWFDTVWPLPSAARWGLSRGAFLLATLTLMVLIVARQRQVTNARVAQRIDQTLCNGGEVLAGFQLATRPVQPVGELSHGFAQLAAQRAVQLLRGTAPARVSDWAGVRQATVLLAVVMTVIAVLGLLVPDIAWHQVQRFLFPARDIPPYTGVEIELSLDPASVVYGQDARVAADITRGRVDELTLVVRADNGQEQALPMLAETEQHWQAVLTRVTEPLSLYARSGASRSKVQRLEVQLTPRIVETQVTITAPAYTHSGIYRGALPERGLVGLAGTEVAWQVSSNRPLRDGQLDLTYRDGSTEHLTWQPRGAGDGSQTVVGAMTLSKPGQFELTVTDVSGLKSHESVTGTITITSDRRPVVRITSPQPVSLSTPDVQLPVSVLAEDDFGISRLTLYRSLNGSPATAVSADVDGAARVQHPWQLPLPAYHLVPGDEIRLFARTEDNDPAGPKGAESPITVVQIISVEQFQEMMLQRLGAESLQGKYQAAQRQWETVSKALDDLAAAQAEAAAHPESTEAARKLQDALAAAQQAATQAAEQMKQLSEQAMPIDVDRELAQRLADMGQQADAMAEQLQAMQQTGHAPLDAEQQQQLQEMRQQTAQSREQLTDQALAPLQQLQQMMPLIADEMRFTQLAQQQRDLSERMAGLKSENTNDAATQRRIAELETEQEQLKQELANLLDDIEQRANQLPDNADTEKLKRTAQKFANDVRQSQANAEMSAAQQALLGDRFSEAQQNADRAADILESFLSDCESMSQDAQGQCKAAFSPSRGRPNLGNSIQQMLAMMGMKPGSSPGHGLGQGAGSGFAQRFPGPQNMGLYGSVPMPQAASRGKGDQQSTGLQTSQVIEDANEGNAYSEQVQHGDASGAAVNSLPPNYRSKVAEYFRSLSTALNAAEKP